MTTLNLSGTPAVRYPDPLVKKVNPNGTQRYTAYQAPLVWFNSDTIQRYATSLYQGYYPYQTNGTIQLLLFGADYIAKLSAVTYFNGTQYYNPITTPVPLSSLTFSEMGVPLNYANYILPTYNPINYYSNPGLEPTYKQIVSGLTKTNSVAVSGFPAMISGSSWDLYQVDPRAPENKIQAGIASIYLDVLMNGAVIDSTTIYEKDTLVIADKGPFIDRSLPNIPVILWEQDLTQKIVDDGYIISGTKLDTNGIKSLDTVIVEANLEVVGLWGRTDGYTPATPLVEEVTK